jgi:hypothetical protein
MLTELSDADATLAPSQTENGEAQTPKEILDIARQLAKEFSFSRHQAERIVARVLALAAAKDQPTT